MNKFKFNILNDSKLVAKILGKSWFWATLFLFIIAIISYRESITLENFMNICVYRGGFTVLLSLLVFHYIYENVSKHKKVYIFLFYLIMYLFYGIPFGNNTLNGFARFGITGDVSWGFNFLYGCIMFDYIYMMHYLYSNERENHFLHRNKLNTEQNYRQLKKQLSPHFLFNNINVLTGLIEENPKKAVQFSSQLSNIYRYFLEQEKKDVVILQDELNFAKDYIELLQGRFGNGLIFNNHISEESKQKYIVSMSLQQVLENAIKHNEVSNVNPVTITVTDENDYISISNNINPKISEVKSSKNGLKNIQKRYTYFSDKKVKIEQNDQQFTVSFPLLNS